jgi:hypothetical protein
MPAAPIDVRAQVFSDLGPVISGQCSDDPLAPGVGLLRTQGEVVISGLIQPVKGTELKLGVRLPDGKLTRFPRRLRVIKAESDPINNETTLTVGCLLALKWELAKAEIFYAIDYPGWIPTNTPAGLAPNIVFLRSVVSVCFDRCAIVSATDNPPLTAAKAVACLDLSDGYLEVANKIIAEAGMYGFIDAAERLQLRSVAAIRNKGPFLTINDVITIDSIGNASQPEKIEISYGQSGGVGTDNACSRRVYPTVDAPPNYKPVNPDDSPYRWNRANS